MSGKVGAGSLLKCCRTLACVLLVVVVTSLTSQWRDCSHVICSKISQRWLATVVCVLLDSHAVPASIGDTVPACKQQALMLCFAPVSEPLAFDSHVATHA